MIKASNIVKRYGNLEVLKGVSLDVAPCEVVSITGASGAGKSTLLQILATLSTPDSGEVCIAGEKIEGMGDKKISMFRNEKIGFVFQFHNLLPEFTALENICIPAYIGGHDRKATEKRATELLEMMNLSQRAHHKPSELSGGEQQRVAIARALINSPKVIFADEPSGNLDSANREEIHNLLFELREKLSITVVVVTHDESLANLADRKIIMRDGEIL